ncbi:MAG: cobalamin-dependent protein [Patescibacteria group bacterium]|nr:cobalamin-dependent protein [Patescibacteria group bacterium]
MNKKRIMFIKPAVVTDAVFDPIRSTIHLGMWYLASELKAKGHDVRYLDEVVRNGGLDKHRMFKRTVTKEGITDEELDINYDEFEKEKMTDFNSLSPEEFIKKYGTEFGENSVTRVLARTGNPLEETLHEIEMYKPDFVGIPLIATANYLSVVELGKAIKEKFPEIKIIIGGQHISVEAKEFSKENPWADHLITGDAVGIIDKVIEAKNIERMKIIKGEKKDYNEFPILDPALLEENHYEKAQNHTYTSSGRYAVDFMFSKGCFKNCGFCVAGTQGKGCVTTIDTVQLDEQLKIFKEHGIRELVVQDDAFIYKPQTHLKKVFELLKKYGFYWQNNGGVDFELLNDEITDMFIEYNREGEGRVTSLYIPFNPRDWNKGQSAAGTMVSKYQRNFENLKRLRLEGGINVLASEIVGTPEQTMDVLEQDVELHKKMISEGYIDGVVSLSATLLPGTRWYQEGRQNIVNEKDYSGYSLFTVHHKTEHIKDPKELEKFMVLRAKELNKVEQTYHWYSAFPNATDEDELAKEREREEIRKKHFGEPIKLNEIKFEMNGEIGVKRKL